MKRKGVENMKYKYLLSILFINLYALPVFATTCYFDNLGRLKKSQTSENNWIEYTYDKDTQNPIKKTQHYTDYGKKQSKITSYKYDKKGNLIEEVNDDKEFGYKFVYSYDDNGRLLSKGGSDSKKPLYAYTYDDKGRKTSETYRGYKDDSKYNITKYEYDSEDREISAITYDEKGTQSSKSTNKYDKNGNRIASTMEFPGDNASWIFVYNDKNQRISMTNSNKDKASYKYDTKGHLIEEIQETNGQKATQTYSYDEHGNLLSTYRNGYLDNTFVWDSPDWKTKVSESDQYGWLKEDKYSVCDPRPFNEKSDF